MAIAFGPMITCVLPPSDMALPVGTIVDIVYPGGATWHARVRKELKPMKDGRRRITVVLLPQKGLAWPIRDEEGWMRTGGPSQDLLTPRRASEAGPSTDASRS